MKPHHRYFEFKKNSFREPINSTCCYNYLIEISYSGCDHFQRDHSHFRRIQFFFCWNVFFFVTECALHRLTISRRQNRDNFWRTLNSIRSYLHIYFLHENRFFLSNSNHTCQQTHYQCRIFLFGKYRIVKNFNSKIDLPNLCIKLNRKFETQIFNSHLIFCQIEYLVTFTWIKCHVPINLANLIRNLISNKKKWV